MGSILYANRTALENFPLRRLITVIVFFPVSCSTLPRDALLGELDTLEAIHEYIQFLMYQTYAQLVTYVNQILMWFYERDAVLVLVLFPAFPAHT